MLPETPWHVTLEIKIDPVGNKRLENELHDAIQYIIYQHKKQTNFQIATEEITIRILITDERPHAPP